MNIEQPQHSEPTTKHPVSPVQSTQLAQDRMLDTSLFCPNNASPKNSTRSETACNLVNSNEPEKTVSGFKKLHQEYLAAHSKLSTQLAHAVGWYGAVSLIATGVLIAQWPLIPAGLAFGYAMAISSHYIFEGNRPKSFEGGKIAVSAFFSDALMSMALGPRLLKRGFQKLVG